jgi:hypothetical protein
VSGPLVPHASNCSSMTKDSPARRRDPSGKGDIIFAHSFVISAVRDRNSNRLSLHLTPPALAPIVSAKPGYLRLDTTMHPTPLLTYL